MKLKMKFICFGIILLQNLVWSYGGTVTQQAVPVTDAPKATNAPKAVPAQIITNEPITTHSHVEVTGPVVAHNYLLEEKDKNAVLTCEVITGTAGDAKWFRSEEIKENAKEFKIHKDSNNKNFSLEVVKVGSGDIGNYFCIINVNGVDVNTTVILYAAPQIKHFNEYKNLVQGDPLVLECDMWGWPFPVVSWQFNHSALNTNDSRVKITSNSHGVPNAKLRLENVDYPDGGVYTCVGINDQSTNTSSIIVNIKNKYAALVPFLGICAEVAILCIVIFIYERRHAKKMEQEEEEEDKQQEEAEHLAGNNEKKEFDDVRHRDVKT